VTEDQPRYKFLLWPNPKRWPVRLIHWIRPVATVLVIALVVLGIQYGPTIASELSCSGDPWAAGNGECVGLSEGPYAFDLDKFGPVMSVIDKQNRSAGEKCDPNGTPVTVGVLMTMTDRLAGSRAVHELEGMAAGQLKANGTGCLHPVKLVVGETGSYGVENTAAEVATELTKRADVVAVVGLGLSHQYSADAADILARAKIPVVADLVTAEGFDQTGSRGDQPVFDSCDPGITYPHGIGKDYFYRVAFRNSQQIAQLGAAVGGQRPDFIMVPTGGSDPYTCTTLPFMQRQFGGNITEVRFDADEPSTVGQTAKRVCSLAKNVSVAYIARGRDLGRFLSSLDDALSSGQCSATSITVLSTSDGNRLRAAEDDTSLEELRLKALRSANFTNGRIRMLFALVAGADRPRDGDPDFDLFTRTFTATGFDISHVDDGWAVNAYDSMMTVAQALGTLPTNKEVQRSEVNTAISGFTSTEQSVPGAGGLITFDNSGNRTDTLPPVVRLCPLPPAASDRPARTTTAHVQPPSSDHC
jgi:ABC-type branched-subunit amino acid transport system substrate-binding protein